jgi:ankyrin repeat protein
MANIDPVVQFHDAVRRGNLTAVAAALTGGIDADARHPDTQFTPLMEAARSHDAPIEMVELLLKHGADPNGIALEEPPARPAVAADQLKRMLEDENCLFDEDSRARMQEIATQMSSWPAEPLVYTVLSVALSSGNLEKVRRILDAGADVTRESNKGYDALMNVLHGRDLVRDAQLIPLIRLLIERGAPLNTVSRYSESALGVASNIGRFDVVKLLLDAGADPAPLGWTPLMHAIACGTLADVAKELAYSPDLSAIDLWERTPFLLSLQTRDIAKAELLFRAKSDPAARGRCGKTPLMYPVAVDDPAMLHWLLKQGFDPDAADQFGSTALTEAVERGKPECVHFLVNAGANLNGTKYDEPLIKLATNLEVVRFLHERGADLNDVSAEMRAAMRKQSFDGPIQSTAADYATAKHRSFGKSNPERMNFPFWQAMVRSGAIAWDARKQFDPDEEAYNYPGAVWCFRRFGQSITELPDGRLIEIAGEHEDHYDPDFCIYNDVVVHHGDGTFDIYGYPEDVFQPTDFHTATLVGEHIYIIGSLGYYGARQPGYTPVYRLDTRRFTMERMATSGAMPGWIYDHKAMLEHGRLRVQGGKVVVKGEKEQHLANGKVYLLDLATLVWSESESIPLSR